MLKGAFPGVKSQKQVGNGGTFVHGVKRDLSDFDPGIQYIFDKLIVMDTFYTSLVKM